MPESLKVVVNIEEDRRKKRQLLVSIRDKTNHPVEFSNGAVIVNNTKLDFSLRTVLTTTRGYYYRIPGDEHEFTITVEWNETDAFTFVIDEAAGFPGFTNTIGINLRTNAKKFSIAPAPFADGKVSVAYDVLK